MRYYGFPHTVLNQKSRRDSKKVTIIVFVFPRVNMLNTTDHHEDNYMRFFLDD